MNNTINLRHLTQRIYTVLYPQNGARIVTIDSVTSLHPVYIRSELRSRTVLTKDVYYSKQRERERKSAGGGAAAAMSDVEAIVLLGGRRETHQSVRRAGRPAAGAGRVSTSSFQRWLDAPSGGTLAADR